MIGPKYGPHPARRRTIGEQSRLQVNRNRAGVYERDHYQCVASSLGGCLGDLTLQHRTNKGAGSSAMFDTQAHLITLCHGHNVREMQDADLRRKFIANGWSVARWVLNENDVGDVPVLYPDGNWYRLRDQHFGRWLDVDGAWEMVKLGIRKEDAF